MMSPTYAIDNLPLATQRAVVKVGNNGPRNARLTPAEEALLLAEKLAYVVHREDTADCWHLTARGYEAAGHIHDPRATDPSRYR